jgi:hypothetical protein
MDSWAKVEAVMALVFLGGLVVGVIVTVVQIWLDGDDDDWWMT